MYCKSINQIKVVTLKLNRAAFFIRHIHKVRDTMTTQRCMYSLLGIILSSAICWYLFKANDNIVLPSNEKCCELHNMQKWIINLIYKNFVAWGFGEILPKRHDQFWRILIGMLSRYKEKLIKCIDKCFRW